MASSSSGPPPMTKVASSVELKTVMHTASASVNAISTAADESFVVIAGRNVLRMVEIADWKLSRHNAKRPGRKSALTSASTDCQCHPSKESKWKCLVATGATNGNVVVWNMQSPRQAPQCKFGEHDRQVVKVSWYGTREPNVLASASIDGTVKLWDMRSQESISTLNPMCDGAREVSFDPFASRGFGAGGYGTYMAVAFDNGSVHTYDTRLLSRPVKNIPAAHSGLVMALQWHPELPGIIATGGRDKNIKVWEVYKSPCDSASFFDKGDVAKTRTEADDEESGEPLVRLQTIFNIGRLAWRPGCPRQIACSASVLHSRVHVWDTAVRNLPVAVFDVHRDVVTGISWLGKGPQAAFLENYRQQCEQRAFVGEESREDDALPSSRQPLQARSASSNSSSSSEVPVSGQARNLNYLLTASNDGYLHLTFASKAFRPHDMLRTTTVDMSHEDISWAFDPVDRAKYWSDEDGTPVLFNEPEDRRTGLVTTLRPATALNGRMITPIPLASMPKGREGTENDKAYNDTNVSPRTDHANPLIIDAFGPPPLWWNYKSETPVKTLTKKQSKEDNDGLESKANKLQLRQESVEYVFVKLARGYQLEGAPVPYLCLHNAEVAASAGAHELRQVWMTIAFLYVAAHQSGGDDKKDQDLVSSARSYARKLWDQLMQKHGSEDSEDNTSRVYRSRTSLRTTTDGLNGSPDKLHPDPNNPSKESSFSNEILSNQYSSLLESVKQDAATFEEALAAFENDEEDTPAEVESSWKTPTVSFPQPAAHLMAELQKVVIQRIIDFYCERGDVQTCASIGRVLASEDGSRSNLVDMKQLGQWELAYADLLHRYRLWSPASTILARSHSEAIRERNQRGTSMHVSCVNCNNPVEPPRMKAQAEAEIHDGSRLVPTLPSACSQCSNFALRCAVCRYMVKGLFLQCVECGVGGHLGCMTTWFRREGNVRNPAGIDHICIR
eukprot:gb/GECG01016006.1/.p1 GENE.gb/GECG01016006.1/~~gb/GECG01016006.1/.p1  ORF type:complete len:956 (+),score=107.07 gb/GECG01016006.1/:1-2868(+)